jgi:hypothetical protein
MHIASTLLLCLAGAFRILDTTHRHPRHAVPCPDLPADALQTLQDAASHVRGHGFGLYVFHHPGASSDGVVCHTEHAYIRSPAYTDLWTGDVLFDRRLLAAPNALYNVLLHELLHVAGLGHSGVPGMMNYSVVYDPVLQVYQEDRDRRWLSNDDRRGLEVTRALGTECVMLAAPC